MSHKSTHTHIAHPHSHRPASNRGRPRVDIPEEVRMVNAHYTDICVQLGVCIQCHSRLTPKVGRTRFRYCDFCHELYGVGKRERGGTK